jgi:UDP-N-acetylglucosamine--N-acetylmuramyl-(pentapeptide) pyrophosphoryl-undecaprenol N-acetylglucosamine transferase
VAQALQEADSGAEVVVVGRRGGVAERLVTEAGLRLETIDISGVDVTSPRSVVRAMTQLPRATIAARSLVHKVMPDVVVGAGGYVSVPLVMAALTRRIPVVLLEQNAYPGRATRLLARRAYAVAASFAETQRHLSGANVVQTGNPLRREVLAKIPAPLGDACRRILVTGGSQGARRLNRAIIGCIQALLEQNPDVRVTHQCGALDFESMATVEATLPTDVRSRYRLDAFFDDLAEQIAACDLVIMRAGGSSLAECAALGRPMILVPYPHAGGHQAHNAMPYVSAGAARLLNDEDCTSDRLQSEIEMLIRDTSRWQMMARASAATGRPDATARVIALITEAARPARHGSAA